MNAVMKKNGQHFTGSSEWTCEVVKVLLENSADVNAVNSPKMTALHLAAREGHVDVTKVLLENGADVNAVNNEKTQHFTSQLREDMVKL